MSDQFAFAALKAEDARLIALLESYGIERRQLPSPVPMAREPEPSKLSSAAKVALSRSLFCGRTDAYPVRWESKTASLVSLRMSWQASRKALFLQQAHAIPRRPSYFHASFNS